MLCYVCVLDLTGVVVSGSGALNPNFLEGSFNLDFGAVRALK